MLGLFGTLNLGARSLQTQQAGIEVASHNLANVNNPNYARQRVAIQTSTPKDTLSGSFGTGANVTAINQIRDKLVDLQIQNETSVQGSLDAQQQALEFAQTFWQLPGGLVTALSATHPSGCPTDRRNTRSAPRCAHPDRENTPRLAHQWLRRADERVG